MGLLLQLVLCGHLFLGETEAGEEMPLPLTTALTPFPAPPFLGSGVSLK